jgi:hypothetical protein
MTNFLEVNEVKLTSQYQVVLDAFTKRAHIHPQSNGTKSLIRSQDGDDISVILNLDPSKVYSFKVDGHNLSLIPKGDAIELIQNNDYGGGRRSQAIPTTLLEVKLSEPTQCQYCPLEGYLNQHTNF